MPQRMASRLSARLGDRAVRQHLGLLVVVGVALIVLGVVAFVTPSVSARVSVRFAGTILLAAGLFQAALAVAGAEGKVGARSLAGGLANVVAGSFFLAAPGAGILTLSLVLAAVYVAVGLYKAVSAYRKRGPHWPWMVALGVLLAAFGGLIGARWPASGIGVIGHFVGIQLIAEGAAWLMIVREARRPRVTFAPEALQKGPVRK